MSRRAPSTLADYLVVAISPALIMLLVGSLMFFLIEVFYQGQYPLRLQFVMAMFVMAIVCIARISMEEGAGYAALFGAPLAAVTALALSRFVQIEGALAVVSLPINVGLMALVWWAAHKLTWDCTLIDDSVDASGQGLLQEIGLDSNGAGGRTSGPPGTSTPYQLEATGGATTDLPWWQRFFDADRRPHAPGVWVVYFSLAALPLFGIGGWFIPASAPEVRQRAMLFLIVYVASGLTLLVSTSFLGLRRYLRQRALEMPIEMAATWVGLGLAIIAATLAICYLLPRPDSLRSIADLPITFTSPDRRANRVAVGPEGGQRQEQPASANAAQPQSGQTGQQESSAGKTGAKDANSGSGAPQGQQSGSPSQSSGGQAGENSNPRSEGQQSKAGPEAKNGDNASESGGQGDRHGDTSNENGTGKTPDPESQKGSGAESTSESGAARTKSDEAGEAQRRGASTAASQRPQQPSAQATEAQSSNSSASQTPPPPNSPPPFSIEWGGLLPWLLRVLFFLATAVVVVWLAWRYRAEVVAAWNKLLAELRELWDRLFGRQRAREIAAAELSPAGPVYRSFASYANPFVTGAAARMSWPELVGYTFQALEAWARERGCSRAIGQTPHEFASALGHAQPQLHRLLPALADAYGQIAYAPSRASAATVEPLRQLWSALQTEVNQQDHRLSGVERV